MPLRCRFLVVFFARFSRRSHKCLNNLTDFLLLLLTIPQPLSLSGNRARDTCREKKKMLWL